MFGARALAALVIAHPLSAIATRTVGHAPRGDAELFDPGALILREVAAANAAALSGLAEQAALIAIASVPIGLALTTMFLVSEAAPTRPAASEVLSGASRLFLGMLVLLLAFTAAEVCVGGLCYLAAEAASTQMHRALGPRGGDLAWAALLALGLLAALLVGVVHDLARVALVERRRGAADAILEGFSWARSRTGAFVAAYWARGSLGVLLALLAAVAAVRIGVQTAPRTAAVAVMHQAVILALVLLRCSWLIRARRIALEPGAAAVPAAGDT
jgi:hypothetical protein